MMPHSEKLRKLQEKRQRKKQERQAASFNAAELRPVVNRPYAGKRPRARSVPSVEPAGTV